MGRKGGRGGVNKKGTPLYSREDIREQYCINDKELQVLDKSQRRSILGCFSNQGQAGVSPCGRSLGGGKRSILGSCIARTTSEDDLHHLDETKRPISPRQGVGTTWNGRNRYHEDPADDAASGFDEHYFRRRPKSFCMPSTGLPPPGVLARHPGMYGTQEQIHLSMGSLVDEHQYHMAPRGPLYYGPHPSMRASPYPQTSSVHGPSGPHTLPPNSMLPSHHSSYMAHHGGGGGVGGGYTLPPSAAYFPMGVYSSGPMSGGPQQSKLLEGASLDSEGMTQPNTPDLLMHRRQMGGANTPELSIDERKQKHVSFDASSLMRSQTLATMDETSFQRAAAAAAVANASGCGVGGGGGVGVPPGGVLLPAHSSERLIDSTAMSGSQGFRDSLDFAYISEILPPELARQIMLERLKRNSMRTQATQTDVNNRAKNGGTSMPNVPSQYSHHMQRVAMVSEAVQTNGGLANGIGSPVSKQPSLPIKMNNSSTSTSPPHSTFRPTSQAPGQPQPQTQSQSQSQHLRHGPEMAPKPPLRQSSIQYGSPHKQIPPQIAQQLPGYKLQVYHLDDKKEKCSAGTSTSPETEQSAVGVVNVPTGANQPSAPQNRRTSHLTSTGSCSSDGSHNPRKHHHHHHHHHHRKLQKSSSEGGSLDGGVGTELRKKPKHMIVPVSMPTTSEDDDLPSDKDMPELAPVCTMSRVPEETKVASPEKIEKLEKRGPRGTEPETQAQMQNVFKSERDEMREDNVEKEEGKRGWAEKPSESRRDSRDLSEKSPSKLKTSDPQTNPRSEGEMKTSSSPQEELETLEMGLNEDEDDLGQRLSPLGSNSSIPDIVRSQGKTGGSMVDHVVDDTNRSASSVRYEEGQVMSLTSQPLDPLNQDHDITRDKMVPLEDRSEDSNTNSGSVQSLSASSPINNDKVPEKLKSSADEASTTTTSSVHTHSQVSEQPVAEKGQEPVASNQEPITISSSTQSSVETPGQKHRPDSLPSSTPLGSNVSSPQRVGSISAENSHKSVVNERERQQIVQEMGQIKSPAHDAISVGSSSSGSYSVTTESNNEASTSKSPHKNSDPVLSGNKSEATLEEKSKPRREELKLDLVSSTPHSRVVQDIPVTGHGSQGVSSPSQLTMSPVSLSMTEGKMETTENNMIWQRVPMGTGDVSKKRRAFEEQIKAQSPQDHPPPPVPPKPKINGSRPGSVKTPITRKIMGSEVLSSPGGLARSPAMHDGFKAQDWVVKRTPINTPAAETESDENKIIVGIINLSEDEEDEEDEAYEDEAEGTSFHIDSEAVFKSGATTPPGGGDDSLRSSLAHSSVEMDQTQHDSAIVNGKPTSEGSIADVEQSQLPEVQQDVKPKVSFDQQAKSAEETLEKETLKTQEEDEQPRVSSEKKDAKDQDSPPNVVALVKPPAGFGDSPDKKPLPVTSAASPLIAQLIGSHDNDEVLVASLPECSLAQSQLPSKEYPAKVKLAGSSSSIEKDSAASAIPEITSNQTPISATMESKSRKGSTTSSMTGCGTTSGTITPLTATSTLNTRKKARSRSRSSSKERLLSKLARDGTSPPLSGVDEDELIGLYIGGYKKTVWAYIGKMNQVDSALEKDPSYPLRRSASIESTQSEREFRKRHQAITHRMVHRKSSAIMYSKILERTFECNKVVKVERIRGEFGFRIHGSRPVVVSAIEPNTPAETSGLEVGDIILTINGVNVLDLPHTEVVKTAQAGRDALDLGVARVDEDGNSATGIPHVPENEEEEPCSSLDVALVRLDDTFRIIHSGYLYKLSRSSATIHTDAVDPNNQTTSIERKWSRRWFVLRADACLYFFKTDKDVRPLGAILISGSQVLPGCEADPRRPFSFTISSKNNEVSLSADDQDDFNRWTNVAVRCGQNPDQEDFWLDVARQRMALALNDLGGLIKADCQGFLLKLDEKAKVWKKRYCVLVDACLFLYAEDDSSSAKAALCLHGYRVQSIGGNLGGNRRHAFELIPPEHQHRYFYFVADTETEKKRWLASFEYSIDRWLKLSEDGI